MSELIQDWKTASATVSSSFPKLSSDFESAIDKINVNSPVGSRLQKLSDSVKRLAGTKSEAAVALLLYSTLGLISGSSQVSHKDAFEVDTLQYLISKLWSAASVQPNAPVEIVDLTELEAQEEDPFTTLDTLKELTLELVSSIDVPKLSMPQWTSSIHSCWTSSVRSAAVNSFGELAAFLTILVENFDVSKLNPFWKEDSVKWFKIAEEANDKLDCAALLYSLELVIPTDKFKSPQKWEGQRYEWHHALKRFPNEGLFPIKEVIRVSYNLSLDEEGHATAGHRCITAQDKALAEADGSALLFGEFLATGVHRAFDKEHLDGSNAQVIYDFGMGLGKLLMQVYLQFPNVKTFVGVELSPSRYLLGRDALRRFSDFTGGKYQRTHEDDKTIRVVDDENRILEFREQNLFDATEGLAADIIILETHFPAGIWDRLRIYLWGMKAGARLLTYENLHNVYVGHRMPFDQIPINIAPNDRFYTTWSPKRGHHFYLWRRNNLVL